MLLHISERAWEHTEDMEDVAKSGEKLQVKLIEVDPRTGRFRLSRPHPRNALLDKPEGYTEPEPVAAGERRGGGGGRGPRRDGGGRGGDRRGPRRPRNDD